MDEVVNRWLIAAGCGFIAGVGATIMALQVLGWRITRKYRHYDPGVFARPDWEAHYRKKDSAA